MKTFRVIKDFTTSPITKGSKVSSTAPTTPVNTVTFKLGEFLQVDEGINIFNGQKIIYIPRNGEKFKMPSVEFIEAVIGADPETIKYSNEKVDEKDQKTNTDNSKTNLIISGCVAVGVVIIFVVVKAIIKNKKAKNS
jgi:hypothetical protein